MWINIMSKMWSLKISSKQLPDGRDLSGVVAHAANTKEMDDERKPETGAGAQRKWSQHINHRSARLSAPGIAGAVGLRGRKTTLWLGSSGDVYGTYPETISIISILLIFSSLPAVHILTILW